MTHYCAEHNLKYSGTNCPRSGWTMARVGCHWTNPRYPSAVVSTFTRGAPTPTQMKSGYGAWVNFRLIGEFATRELAQRAIEATERA